MARSQKNSGSYIGFGLCFLFDEGSRYRLTVALHGSLRKIRRLGATRVPLEMRSSFNSQRLSLNIPDNDGV
jgi:hypothetical protein